MQNKIVKENIVEALNWRYATQVFDSSKIIDAEDLKIILESARLSPSANGIEMWKFIVVENPEIRAQIRAAGHNQAKITDASHLIVIAYRTDAIESLTKERIARTAKAQNQKPEELSGLKNALDKAVATKTTDGTLDAWIKAQTYIPLGIMIETASLLKIDNGPMEGFQSDKVDEILGLKEKNLKSITLLALGYRGVDGASARPKVRRPFEEVVEFVK